MLWRPGLSLKGRKDLPERMSDEKVIICVS